ncbi:MAG TPA: hypothetical protein VK876_08485, partial [Rubrivivax sp.]|nr:hypothetical protein [Rubrivivax sp.]
HGTSVGDQHEGVFGNNVSQANTFQAAPMHGSGSRGGGIPRPIGRRILEDAAGGDQAGSWTGAKRRSM